MMTTGYDCPDILNLVLFRPIFSPTDFIQIKGRGTRKHNFLQQLFDDSIKESSRSRIKPPTNFSTSSPTANTSRRNTTTTRLSSCPNHGCQMVKMAVMAPRLSPAPTNIRATILVSMLKEETIGTGGMKIDRMFFQRFEDTVRDDKFIAKSVETGQWDRVIDYVNREVFDKPTEFYSLDKLRRAPPWTAG